MPDLWIPGIPRVDSSAYGISLPRQGRGFRVHDWHTFETGSAGYNYSPDGISAATYLHENKKFATFVLHPTTGALVQLLPADVGAWTLKAGARAGLDETNGWGDIHMSTEVIANANRPFTLDLTRAGLDALQTLINFLRDWGIPDQWAWRGRIAWWSMSGLVST